MTREEYLLTCMGEECNEIAQRISKALRFGMQEQYRGKTNEQYILDEFHDLLGVVKMLDDENIIKFAKNFDKAKVEARIAKVNEYFKYAKTCGTIFEVPTDSQALAMIRASQD